MFVQSFISHIFCLLFAWSVNEHSSEKSSLKKEIFKFHIVYIMTPNIKLYVLKLLCISVCS